ncbi:hypothetical protein DERF_002445 [Dermatophagoides farinae]|uniref:Secreted protein n=1 Tax=Dermatophagoides farinae TaxID=6954 RepID=A0A922LAM5_DERFA|nr:hypothetical protein DERF_002445 [Dermatophagoides farinae]
MMATCQIFFFFNIRFTSITAFVKSVIARCQKCQRLKGGKLMVLNHVKKRQRSCLLYDRLVNQKVGFITEPPPLPKERMLIPKKGILQHRNRFIHN